MLQFREFTRETFVLFSKTNEHRNKTNFYYNAYVAMYLRVVATLREEKFAQVKIAELKIVNL